MKMRAVLVLWMIVAVVPTGAAQADQSPTSATVTQIDAARMHTRSYRQLRNADDLRDISDKRGLILRKCRADKVRYGADKLNDICRYHLAKADKTTPGIWRGISSCGPKGEVCID